MRTKSISRPKTSQLSKGFFFKQNPHTQHSFFDVTESNKFFGAAYNTIYRQSDKCSEEGQIQRKSNDATAMAPAHTHTFLNNLNHSGHSLPRDQQQFFGQRMNYDFGEVKIHANQEAAQSASALNAHAYTHKNHIVFNNNRYQPSSREGKKLLAHELTHVTQQTNPGKLLRQTRPQPEPGAQRPGIEELMPLDPVERERWRERRAQAQLERQTTLRQEILPILERNDAAALMSRLRSLTGPQASDILNDDVFMSVLQIRFQGTALWSVLSILFNTTVRDPLLQRLDLAILSREAQVVTDLLGVLQPLRYISELRRGWLRIVLHQIFGGHPLEQQMMRLLLGTPTPETGHLTFESNAVHYEPDEHGRMALRLFGGTRSVDYRSTATQMRIVVRMNFIQPTRPIQPFYFVGGSLPSVLENWLTTIHQIWNNRFYLYNGHTALLLVFVPMAVHSGVNQIEVHTNDSEHCPRLSDPGRSTAGCFFTSDSGNAIAHEFGHMIGASDEYNLPATAAEIPAGIQSQMSADDIRLSTVQGITRRSLPARQGGHDIADSLMAEHEASQHVDARHVQRLVNAINAQLPAGVPPYQIRRTGS